MTKQKCKYCNNAIVSFGDRRKNGRESLNDWDKRNLHKKCFKEINKIITNHRHDLLFRKCNMTSEYKEYCHNMIENYNKYLKK